MTIHDLIPLEHPEWFGKRFSLLYKVLIPNLVRRATHLAAVSKFTKSRLVELLRVEDRKVTVIENGVGDEFVIAPDDEIARVRSSLQIPDGPYLLSLCSLEPRKNLARLLEAWNQLGARRTDANLVIAGGKGSSGVFRGVRLNLRSDRVLFTGYVADADLPALYSGAQAFVYPSLYEGFGLPVLEALACGSSVITSHTTSIPEVAGDQALLIDPLSVSELSDAMQKALSRGPTSEERNARRAHALQFGWNRTAVSTERLLLSYC